MRFSPNLDFKDGGDEDEHDATGPTSTMAVQGSVFLDWGVRFIIFKLMNASGESYTLAEC